MLRRCGVAVLVAGLSLAMHGGPCRADDFEAALLEKFKNQNRSAGSQAKKSPAKPAPAAPAVTAVVVPPLGRTLSVLVVTGGRAVRVPDGGIRVLNSMSVRGEVRNEAGVPVLGGVPYLGRGFRNVGYGQFAGTVQSSVSVRIINLAEEDARLLGRK